MEDGKLTLDWVIPKGSDENTPIVLILPGMTGSNDTSYVRHFVRIITGQGYCALVFTSRGNGNSAVEVSAFAIPIRRLVCSCNSFWTPKSKTKNTCAFGLQLKRSSAMCSQQSKLDRKFLLKSSIKYLAVYSIFYLVFSSYARFTLLFYSPPS